MKYGFQINTSSYEFARHGKKPEGIDYYCFEVTCDGGRRTVSNYFHGDYENGLKRMMERYENIVCIEVGI